MFSQFCCSFWLNVRSLRGISWSLYGVNQKKEQMLEFTYLHDVFKIYLQYPFPSTSVQFSSLAQSCPALCDPMNCSTPGLPVHHQFSELTQTHDHWVGDAIQPSHSLLFLSSRLQSFPASRYFPVSQLITSGGQSIGVSVSGSVLPMNIQDWFL